MSTENEQRVVWVQDFSTLGISGLRKNDIAIRCIYTGERVLKRCNFKKDLHSAKIFYSKSTSQQQHCYTYDNKYILELPALIKKKILFSSYIRKFREIGCKVIYCMTNDLLIYGENICAFPYIQESPS
jgi:hypothetical protein